MTQIIWADSLTGPNLITGQLKISIKQQETGPTTELMIPVQGMTTTHKYDALHAAGESYLQKQVRFFFFLEVNVTGNLAFLHNAILLSN